MLRLFHIIKVYSGLSSCGILILLMCQIAKATDCSNCANELLENTCSARSSFADLKRIPDFFRQNRLRMGMRAASDYDLIVAKCRKELPTDSELNKWMSSYCGSKSVTTTAHGIEFEDECPQLIELFDKLSTRKISGWLDESISFGSQCHKVLCVVKEKFGDKVGPYLLYMLGKYGMNGSQFTDDHADPWAENELEPVLRALENLPPGLLPIVSSKKMIRFKRGSTYQEYDNLEKSAARGRGCVAANAEMEFFDCGFNSSYYEQEQTAFHEMSHYIAGELGLDDSADWFKLSDWEETTEPNGKAGFNTNWHAGRPECIVSTYAETNPEEDFAESMVAYRYNPEMLKTKCPKKYNFLKNMVFAGIDYSEEKLCQSKAENIPNLHFK